jgi:hypothetical protein
MKKLATLPYGSRLYGTFTEQSDYDWKVITLPDIADMLAGAHLKNVFYSTSSNTVKNNAADTDLEYIPLQIFAKDFLAGQTYAIEIAFGILQRDKIPGVVIHDLDFVAFIEELVSKFLTSNVNKMVGYAYSQAQLYSDKGDRLEKLHQFLDFIKTAQQMEPPLLPEDPLSLVLTIPRGASIMDITDKMLYLTTITESSGRVVNCVNLLEKLYPVDISINEAITRVTNTIKKYGARANIARENDGNDWKALSHAIRICLQANDILDTHYLQFPTRPDVAHYLKKIKVGEFPRKDIQNHLVKLIDAIKDKQVACKLPTNNEELNTAFNAWLRIQLTKFYKV